MSAETVADVVAEMRREYYVGSEYDGAEVQNLVDRVEAAHKREVEAITAKLDEARHCWKVWSERADELKNKCNEQYAKLKTIGNGAKMREALIQARAAICKKAKYQCQSLSWENCNIQANCGDILCSWRGLCEAKTAINAALSKPPRNCDVIAPHNLVDEFCKFMDFDIMDERNGFADGQYKFMQEHWFEFSKWITMPYKPKEGGAKCSEAITR